MLYMPKVADHWKVLNDQKVKDFVVITFEECFKCTTEVFSSQLNEEKIFKKFLNCFAFFNNI